MHMTESVRGMSSLRGRFVRRFGVTWPFRCRSVCVELSAATDGFRSFSMHRATCIGRSAREEPWCLSHAMSPGCASAAINGSCAASYIRWLPCLTLRALQSPILAASRAPSLSTCGRMRKERTVASDATGTHPRSSVVRFSPRLPPMSSFAGTTAKVSSWGSSVSRGMRLSRRTAGRRSVSNGWDEGDIDDEAVASSNAEESCVAVFITASSTADWRFSARKLDGDCAPCK